MRRLLLIPAALLLVTTLGGCSSPAPASPSTTPTAVAATTKTADIRPWTSVVTQQAAELSRSQKKLDDENCSAGSAGAMPCGALYVAHAFDLQTIALTLSSATTSSAKTYLGDPPAEIASRYEATEQAAQAASDAGEKWMKKCSTSTTIKCHGIAFKFDQAVAALQSDFDAWGPYL